MKRISKQVKAIADAHIMAKSIGKFNEAKCSTQIQLVDRLKEGYTFKLLMDVIEINYVTITSLMMCEVGYVSNAYKKGVYKGFKELLNDWNV